MTAFKPLPMSASTRFSQYRDGVMDLSTFEDVAAFVSRTTGRSLDCVKGLILWADELIVCRDARGSVCAAHGFKFVDMRVLCAPYRLIFTVFSTGDHRAGDRDTHLLRVAALIYSRERVQTQNAALVWVTSTSEEPKFFSNGQKPTLYRAGLGSSSLLPQSTRVYTDTLAAMSTYCRVPPIVETAIVGIISARNQVVASAQRGETLLLPCLPAQQAA